MKSLLSIGLILFSIQVAAQELNKKVNDPYERRLVLINECTRDGMANFSEFKKSYQLNYASYTPDSLLMPKITKALKNKKITIVFGSWCGDSKKVVPEFYKILDKAKIDSNVVKLIAVNASKKTEVEAMVAPLKIERVPTIIFYNAKGKELGRIIENPKQTLEKDMLKILAKTK